MALTDDYLNWIQDNEENAETTTPDTAPAYVVPDDPDYVTTNSGDVNGIEEYAPPYLENALTLPQYGPTIEEQPAYLQNALTLPQYGPTNTELSPMTGAVGPVYPEPTTPMMSLNTSPYIPPEPAPGTWQTPGVQQYNTYSGTEVPWTALAPEATQVAANNAKATKEVVGQPVSAFSDMSYQSSGGVPPGDWLNINGMGLFTDPRLAGLPTYAQAMKLGYKWDFSKNAWVKPTTKPALGGGGYSSRGGGGGGGGGGGYSGSSNYYPDWFSNIMWNF